MYLGTSNKLYNAIKYWCHTKFTVIVHDDDYLSSSYIMLRRRNMLMIINTAYNEFCKYDDIYYMNLIVANNFKMVGMKSFMELRNVSKDVEAYKYLLETNCRRCSGTYENKDGRCARDYLENCDWGYSSILCVNSSDNSMIDAFCILDNYLLDDLVYCDFEDCILTINKTLTRYDLSKYWCELCSNIARTIYGCIMDEN